MRVVREENKRMGERIRDVESEIDNMRKDSNY